VEQPADDAQPVHPPAELFSTPLAARQLPDAGELKLLEPLRGQVPTKCSPGVQGPGHRWLGHHPRPAVAGPGPARSRPAGTRWRPPGQRQGEPLAFTFLNGQSGMERLLLPWKRNLAQIGVTLNIRNVDSAQYVNRLMARDYDMIVTGYPVTLSPGAELYNYFGSPPPRPWLEQPDGAQDPAVDHLIDGLVRRQPGRHAAPRPCPGPGAAMELLLDPQLLPAGQLHRVVEPLRPAQGAGHL
jgi:microcin C transport system substrate-binding protein